MGRCPFLQRSSLYFFSESLIIYGMNNYIEETKKSSFKTHRGVCSGSDLISSFLCFISCYQCASSCGLLERNVIIQQRRHITFSFLYYGVYKGNVDNLVPRIFLLPFPWMGEGKKSDPGNEVELDFI